MISRYLSCTALVIALCCAMISSAWAGSTGSLSGAVSDAAGGAAVSGAKVTAVSPSQSVTATTDAGGHFVFLSLAPDTYSIAVEAAGYQTLSTSGVTIYADQTQNLPLGIRKTLRTIGSVTSRSAQQLVRPGAVADSYSVNAATQARITGLNGGGSLNQAFSALAATPGVYVPSGQSGWSQMAGVTIRGGTHSQVGYEFDGVPVSVGINGFPGNNLSTLGQQEVQVYSGSAPLNSESQGISGFVNQVVKTGTYPGTTTVDVGLGSPSFYHKVSAEFSGATKNRLFSYYVGFLGANQDFRTVDQYNGAAYNSLYGPVYAALPCPGGPQAANFAGCYGVTTPNGFAQTTTPGGLGVGPGGFVRAPVNFLAPAYQEDRENVINLHLGVPHKDGGRDDVQFLYQTGGITSQVFSSANDLGVAPYAYPVGHIYTGPLGGLLPANYASLVQSYSFPSNGGTGLISANERDTQHNDQAILKLQYQHNMGSNAYVRAYAYSLYSDFLWFAPNGASSPASASFGEPPDYKLWTHATGYSTEFADQITSQHLLMAQASFTHAPSVRDNSTTWATGGNTPFAVAVDSTNPAAGVCYTVAGGAATPASCQRGGGASAVTYNGATGATAAPASLAGVTCGAGPCAYYAVDNGLSGAFNNIAQNTVSGSLSDQWKPTDRFTIEYGLRYHDYQITGANTDTGTRPFWFNAYNTDYCVNVNPGSTPVSKKSLAIPVTATCATANRGGLAFMSPGLTNEPANYNFIEFEPRIGLTYAASANDVFRLSYGKYTQPAPTAYQQYNTHQQNLAAYLAQRFYKYGYVGAGHDIPPQESYNLDGSLEHGFKNSDVSFKVTPFYRTTKNELTEFFIDPANQLTSGLAVGSLRTSGVEVQLRKGSFDRNGFAALLSYTYTNARIHYNTLPGGGSIIAPINNDIKTYNAYTSFCASHAGDSRCGATSTGVNSAACFTAAGTPDATCAATSFANPYWNAPVQSVLDPGGSYWPTDPVVATTGLGVNGYTEPHVATFVLNYRHNAFAITPSLQFQGGQRYGSPEANAGIDPAAGCGTLAGSTAGDPRYPYGSAGGAPYNALTCAAALNAIPNVFTGKFDSIGAFTSPSQLIGSLTASYDINKRVTLSLTAANLVNQCFGGTKAAWTGIGSPHVCSYESGEVSRAYAPTGNAYNPGVTFDPFAQNPYFAYLGPYTMGVVNPNAPFSLYLNASIRL